MQFKVVNSNSSGNCYILETESEALLIECGVRFQKIKLALNFNLRKVVGCLISHEHGDHAKGVHELIAAGIEVWATEGTHEAMQTQYSHCAQFLVKRFRQVIGRFEVIALPVHHDAKDPVCFLIRHPECGTVLFLTDTVYSDYKFEKLNNIIIEANYEEELLMQNLDDAKYRRDRVLQSHMSIETCKDFLRANDLSHVHNIVLIHLSDSNSDQANFIEQVRALTGKSVWAADAGMKINFDKTPF
jgi:phosphoribosyl 1,2-cyclic phosphodiesterase